MNRIIWGGPPPPPQLGQLQRLSTLWWDQYAAGLSAGPARDELERASAAIVETLPKPTDWGARPTPFKGLVVGAVQSGKTRSMIGVAAIALDQGFRIVVVLAGLKDDLRRQTALRFNQQLLRQNDPIPGVPGASTLGGDPGPGPLGGFALDYYYDSNQVPTLQVQMERALRRGQPCLLVVKKNAASLRDVAKALRAIWLRTPPETLPMLVLDDECDEASVATPGADRTIPDAIAGIWSGVQPSPHVAYVGYTATAAAALLQSPQNTLFPSHFVHLLRYPAALEGPLSYRVPDGDSWYTGGGTYYQEFGDEPGEDTNFLVVPEVAPQETSAPIDESHSLYDGLIAFFVGGAMRLVGQPDRDLDDPARLPSPHSMMVQTSTSVDDHRRWREAIRTLLRGEDMGEGTVLFDERLLMQRVDAEQGRWREWFEKLNSSRNRVYEQRPHTEPQVLITWDKVLERLPSVFRHTNLKAVNSDGGVGQTLDYEPKVGPDGATLAPQDVYVIAVGGSKLSRGLTLQGLGISYYTRAVDRPLEDTTLQSSRWFGYRGPHLEFCRLFTTEETYERLKDIQVSDYDHRLRLADLMEKRVGLEDARLALRTSPTGILTAKLGVGTVHDLALSPWSRVYSQVEIGDLAELNETLAVELVQRIRSRGAAEVRGESGGVRGLISRDWQATEVAALLDRLSLSEHNPDPQRYPMPELYRPADETRRVGRSLDTENDPYVAAAYLRFWAEQQPNPPRFNVGVTFGTMLEGAAPFDFPLLNRLVSGRGRMEGSWSGRSGRWRGDAFFDDPPAGLVSSGGSREEGADGLLLLHVVHRDATGRSGRGIRREFHSPAFGISIPAGGPNLSVVVNYGL